VLRLFSDAHAGRSGPVHIAGRQLTLRLSPRFCRDADRHDQQRQDATRYLQCAERLGVSGTNRGLKAKGNEMRVFVASLIVLSVLYFWDNNYNDGKLLDGLESMRRDIFHNVFR
jgi:hypothetical protein